MKLLHFNLDISGVENGRLELADNSKLLLFQHDPSWFDVLDFENDSIFLEPQLFYYFRSLFCNISNFMSLDQIFYGYLPSEKQKKRMNVWMDNQGIIYLPNIGYFFTNLNGNKYVEIELIDSNTKIILSNEIYKLFPIAYTKNKKFQINLLNSPIFEELNVIHDASHLEASKKSLSAFEEGLGFIEKYCSHFYETISMTTKEFSFFESSNYHSFAALHHFGTSFLNTKGNTDNPIFFLDDIAHQAGHVLFYSLTHNTEIFLKPNGNTLLKEFSGIESEDRTIYSAFHGLFTYTTILHCLDTCYRAKNISNLQKEEILTRIGYICSKFEKDLIVQNNSEVFTHKGREYFDAFQSGFNHIKQIYVSTTKEFDYSNQGYEFSFLKFQQVNQRITV